MLITKRSYKKKYVIGRAGIFGFIGNFFVRMFSCNAAKQLASAAVQAGKTAAKDIGMKAIDVGKTVAIDSHLFIKTLGNSKEDISCIPNNEENSISLTKQVIIDNFVNKEGKEVNVKREFRFIDSLRFMASSLDKLSSNLKIYQFVNLKKYYSGNQLSLLLRKGVYQWFPTRGPRANSGPRGRSKWPS